jgi:hypothetical protein
MKNLFRVLLVTITGILLIGCQVVSGSGNIETRDYELSDFNKIEINRVYDVIIRPSNEYKVTITADDNIHQYIEARTYNGELSLDLDEGRTYNAISITLKAEISMPDLAELEINGASKVGFAGIHSKDLFISVNGASDIIGDLKVDNDLKLDLEGAVKVHLKGVAGGDLDLELRGVADANLRNFRVNNASIELNGASKTQIWSTDTIYGEINGTSQLIYYGNPELEIDKAGLADIKQGD